MVFSVETGGEVDGEDFLKVECFVGDTGVVLYLRWRRWEDESVVFGGVEEGFLGIRGDVCGSSVGGVW